MIDPRDTDEMPAAAELDPIGFKPYNTLQAWAFACAELDQLSKDAESPDRKLRARAKAVCAGWDKMAGGNIKPKLLEDIQGAVNAYRKYKQSGAGK